MPHYFKWIVPALLLGLLWACEEPAPISTPLIAFNFNNSLKNTGMEKTAIFGPQAASYAYSKKDTSLDLSINATTRQAISIKLKDNFSLSDYQGYTVAFWVKKHPSDPEPYTILSHTSQDSTGIQGWQFKTQSNGAWEWSISDSNTSWQYQPTPKQSINDGNWHMLAFSFNKSGEEARLYYDGQNVATYSLQNNNINIKSSFIHIGTNGNAHPALELFNGELDDLLIWSRIITEREIKTLYHQKVKGCMRSTTMNEQLTIMTWNLWQGGQFDGRFVGRQRIVELIEEVNPDVILLQESGDAGTFIADALDYKLYQRSNNLCLLTRFPIATSHNIFQPENAGCVEIQVNDEQTVVVCPIQLTDKPDLSDYIQSGVASTDSIVQWETATRGKEARFILSELKLLIDKADAKPLIIAGDFNSGSHLDWTTKNARHNYGLTIPFPTSRHFEENGFTDTYRAIYNDETQNFGYTVSPRFETIMKNRTNFIYFKGQHLTPVNSYLVDEHPKGFPSDHAALVTVFQWLD